MKATDYLDMPELISNEYKVYLDEDERSKYEEMKDELVLQLPGCEITAANAASLSGKLSQLANGAIYDDDGSVNTFHERKLDAFTFSLELFEDISFIMAKRCSWAYRSVRWIC